MDFDDLPRMPAGYEVPQFIKALLENFDVALYQIRLVPDPIAHLSIIRNLYVHDLMVSAIVALNLPRSKDILLRELSVQIEILEAITNPIAEEDKN